MEHFDEHFNTTNTTVISDANVYEEKGFRVEERYGDRMMILSPVREDGNYSNPEYTYIFTHGLLERAKNYKNMYLNPEKPQRFPLPNSKYTENPFHDRLPGDNYRIIFFNGPKRANTRFKGRKCT